MPAHSRDRSLPRRAPSPLRPRLEHLEDRLVPNNTLSVSDATLMEGDTGTADMVFTITRTGDLSSALTVGYTTANGTAAAGDDYTPASGTVTFAATVGSVEVRVPVVGDQLGEADETFTLSLTGPILGSGAPFTLAPRQTTATLAAPHGINTVDLNADGKPDLLVANRDSDRVSVYLNTTPNGSATVSFATRLDILTGSEAYDVGVGDLNADGKPDVAVANRNSSTVTVLLNTTPNGGATASFAVGVNFGTQFPDSITVGDVNVDGKADLVLGSGAASRVAVFLNTTTAGATTPTFAAYQDFSTGPVRVLLADVNGDGRPDIVSAGQVSSVGVVSVLLNTTTAGAATVTFAAVQTLAVVNVPAEMMVGDLNGDGKPDFVTSGSGPNAISVLLNTTPTNGVTVTTAPRQDFAAGITPQGVVIADLDGDGKPDVVVANRNTVIGADPANNLLSFFRNETQTGATQVSFALRQDVAGGSGEHGILAVDLNGDGRRDIAVTDRFDNTLSIHLQGAFTVVDGVGVGTIADNDRLRADVAARSATSGTWTVLRSTGTAFQSVNFGTWNPSAGWRDVLTGDFDGDGTSDVVGRTSSGLWWVGRGTGGGFVSTLWASWNEAAGWRDVRVGDFTGDGKADLAGRTSSGQWWVAASTGSGFATSQWTSWNEAGGWRDVLVGDFTGDGKADLAGRTANGQWWVGTSSGAAFTNTKWADWNEAAGWKDVSVGDFNGDGKAEVIGRTSNGQWWVGTSTGSVFASSLFASWNEAAGWRGVQFADFNGDGKTDVAARTSSGQWWVGTSSGTAFATSLFASWNEAAGWENVMAGDFNGDGKADIAGRAGDQWWVGTSSGTAFSTTLWGTFPVGGPYVDVRRGLFTV
jgi:hypothetical protein